MNQPSSAICEGQSQHFGPWVCLFSPPVILPLCYPELHSKNDGIIGNEYLLEIGDSEGSSQQTAVPSFWPPSFHIRTVRNYILNYPRQYSIGYYLEIWNNIHLPKSCLLYFCVTRRRIVWLKGDTSCRICKQSKGKRAGETTTWHGWRGTLQTP